MKTPIFYRTELISVENPIKEIYKDRAKYITLKDRMGSEEALCPDCGKNEWWFLPKASSAVRQGGKPYIECLNCGYITHL